MSQIGFMKRHGLRQPVGGFVLCFWLKCMLLVISFVSSMSLTCADVDAVVEDKCRLQKRRPLCYREDCCKLKGPSEGKREKERERKAL